MRWFRLRQRWGTCFALAALLIQLVVAAGHVHLDAADQVHLDAADRDHLHFTHVDTHADMHGDSVAVASEEHGHDTSGVPHAPDRNHCADCALIHLAQTLVAPAAPALAQPDLVGHRPVSEPAAALATRHTALFQARAPPFA